MGDQFTDYAQKGQRRNPSKKIFGNDDMLNSSLPALLQTELDISAEWQKKILTVDGSETQEKQSGEDSLTGESRGDSFPGLTSQYQVENVWLSVDSEASATNVLEQLGLPKGED